MLTCGTLENFRTTWNTIFEKMITCGTLLNFMTTWNILFLKYCLHVGLMLVYDIFLELMASQNNMKQERPATLSTVMTKKFLSLNLLGSEIL
jgi:hypothetical protein